MKYLFKKKTNWITLIMLCIYEVFVAFFIFIWGYAFVSEVINNEEYSEFLIVTLILLFLFIFILDLILWQIKGYEELIISNEYFIINKKGKLFTSKNKIKIFEIESVSQESYKSTFETLFVRVMGIRGGKLCIKYLGRKIYIGQSLTNNEAIKYFDEINKKFLSYKNDFNYQ